MLLNVLLAIVLWRKYKIVTYSGLPVHNFLQISHNIYSPTKVKHHLTCCNNIFSNNELISNRFAVFVTCTHILTCETGYWSIFICMTFFSITVNYFNMKSTTTSKGWNKTFNVLNEIMFYIRAFSNHLPFWHVYDYVSFNKLIFLTISVLWL